MGSCKETISLTLTGRSANWGQTLRLVEKPHGCVIDRLTDEDLRVVDPGLVAVKVEIARALRVFWLGGMYGGFVWL